MPEGIRHIELAEWLKAPDAIRYEILNGEPGTIPSARSFVGGSNPSLDTHAGKQTEGLDHPA